MKKSDIDVARLCQAMRRSRLALRNFREERREAVRQYVGRHWSEEGTRTEVPVNLIALYVQIISRNLIAKNPRVMLSTFQRQYKPVVTAMQSWANKEIERMDLANTLQRIVVDALFSIGICKVALGTAGDAASLGWNLRAGEPFAMRVDLDDFCFDIHARDFSEVGFIGHRYRMPRLAAEEFLGRKIAAKLQTSNDPFTNPEGGDERIKQLGQQYTTGDSEEFEEHVDLWEVYCPRHRRVFTLQDDYLTGGAAELGWKPAPLKEQEWIGPDRGPYKILSFGVVPGNAMPKAPVQDLIDLHEAANHSYRKLMRTMERIKETTLYKSSAAEASTRVQLSNDGDMIPVQNPEDFKQMVFSGQHAQTVLAIATTMKDLFSFMGGNLELLGGRGPQSKTASQDELLNQNAGQGISDMQERTVTFAADVLKSLCWYWHHDPFKVMTATHPVRGLANPITRHVFPHGKAPVRANGTRGLSRDHSFEDMEIRIDPYSLQHSSPKARLATLNQIMQTIVLPLMPLLQQHGISIDLNAYLQKVGDWVDEPDLQEVLTIVEPPSPDTQQGSTPDGPAMPQNTNREYTRHNVSQQTTQGHDQQLVSSMLGHDIGGAQRNGQPTGAAA